MSAMEQRPVLDREVLQRSVRQDRGCSTVEIADWSCDPITYPILNPTSAGLYRVRGSGHERGAIVSWSLVLKRVQAPVPTADRSGWSVCTQPTDWNYWRREACAYGSGLLDDLPPGLRAPRCYGVVEQPDGRIQLWLEDVSAANAAAWSLTHYGQAAGHLGRFNGAYLLAQPRPSYGWLSRQWLRRWVATYDTAIPLLAGVLHHPLVRRGYPGRTPARLAALWADRLLFLAALDRLPQTLCHLDACRRNLFLPAHGTAAHDAGTTAMIAIDWAFVGYGPLGQDLAPLVGTSTLFDTPVPPIEQVGEGAFARYAEEVRALGWQGDLRLMRLGYATSLALHFGSLLGSFWRYAVDENAYRPIQRAVGYEIADLMDRTAETLTYVLDRADEARSLIAGDERVTVP